MSDVDCVTLKTTGAQALAKRGRSARLHLLGMHPFRAVQLASPYLHTNLGFVTAPLF